MTRQEVRSAILDELGLNADSVVWDIGAGTGSVAAACALTCPNGEVHAMERLPEAAELIRQNRRKFRAFNLFVHEGNAPESLEGLKRPTHVFIGGSGGRLDDILRHIVGLGGGIVITISAVTLETMGDASRLLMNSEAFEQPSVLSISAARSRRLGDSSLIAGQNPVTLWTTRTTGEETDERRR
jgi:precorrin-6Y C5,15-methyltransferase (decarboxylating)